jgi:hypothetical protein
MGLGLFKIIEPIETKPLKIEDLTPAQESYETANTVKSPILSEITQNINKRKTLGYYNYRYNNNIPGGIRYQLKTKDYNVVERSDIIGFRDPDDADTAIYRYYYDIYWDFSKDDIKLPEDH